ncbi:preprotein translocase subunit SecG [Mangrovibacterium marinum]|uniref:Protein-export membrane protein SecG n=1 Tax=Mangrovibacterium marinum TaxID=1639118 RepID=A0A2T5C279_9BACT|nr:preprotein translocase subunit SecG [Mangrovibacterium marinum]PTN08767.1 protein translocase subunit secG [Mangrovibacterium marinum]
MYTLITVLIFVACVLLILIVLVQNSKGGGLASNFQSTNQIMGVRKTNDFLEKATWVLATALLVLSIAGSAFIPHGAEQANESAIKNQVEQAVDPNAVPSFPTATPDAAPVQADSAQ